MKIRPILLFVASLLPVAASLNAHCQVPCGIYADDVVFGELTTDVQTITKAMREIHTLGSDVGANPHQLVRWINNKEDHAINIQQVISDYFLARRIQVGWRESNPVKYTRMVNLAHEITVLAMKCRQTTDLANAAALESALTAFQEAYDAD